MAANEIHVNDVGTTFQLTFKDDGAVVDISTGQVGVMCIWSGDGSGSNYWHGI